MALLGYVEYNGIEYEVPEIDSMTPRERALCRRMTGMAPVEAGQALVNADDSAMLWILAVASRRAGADLDIERIWDEEGLKIKLTTVEERRKQEEAAAGRPPDEGGDDEPPEAAASASTEPTPPTTPGTSGAHS